MSAHWPTWWWNDGANAPHYVVEQRLNEPPESVVLRLDSTKSHVELGWKPLLSIADAVAMTVEWYLKYRHDPVRIRGFRSSRSLSTPRHGGQEPE